VRRCRFSQVEISLLSFYLVKVFLTFTLSGLSPSFSVLKSSNCLLASRSSWNCFCSVIYFLRPGVLVSGFGLSSTLGSLVFFLCVWSWGCASSVALFFFNIYRLKMILSLNSVSLIFCTFLYCLLGFIFLSGASVIFKNEEPCSRSILNGFLGIASSCAFLVGGDAVLFWYTCLCYISFRLFSTLVFLVLCYIEWWELYICVFIGIMFLVRFSYTGSNCCIGWA